MAGKTTFQLEFLVHTAPGITENAATITIVNTDFSFSADIDNLDIAINISKINVANIIVNSCAFGSLSAVKLRLEINNGFRLALKFINPFLASHPIPFPGNIIPVFQMHDLVLDYYNGYVFAGMSVTFLAPQAELELAQAVEQVKDQHQNLYIQ